MIIRFAHLFMCVCQSVMDEWMDVGNGQIGEQTRHGADGEGGGRMSGQKPARSFPSSVAKKVKVVERFESVCWSQGRLIGFVSLPFRCVLFCFNHYCV